MNRPLLEIAAVSVAAALAAQQGGADRLELCTGLEVGGLTPSLGLMALVRERVRLPIHVLIRPRAGDFLYDDDEFDIMCRDIEQALALGCEGVVLGVLDADGKVDVPRCRALIGAAKGMDITFHRAIDVCRDPSAALEELIALGCNRVLTSGGASKAPAGAANIRALIEQAAGRIEVLPGGGVTPENIASLAQATGADQFHASAKRQLPGAMRFARGTLADMEAGAWTSDVALVRGLREALVALPA
ncbi:MAG TPA: copper homeostasis protein CutC [Rhodanobacteraceae bacterium]